MTTSRARMTAVSLALLVLVQSGWEVEESPLAPKPWVVQSATPIDDESVGVIAYIPAFAPDGGSVYPYQYAIFVARGGAEPELLGHFDAGTGESTGSGTGFTVSTLRGEKSELLRVRLGKPSTLVSLGQFAAETQAVSCDDQIADCVFAMMDGNALHWRAGALTPLFTLPEDSDFKAWGAAMRPDGGVVALGLGASTAILSFGSDTVTVLRGALTLTRPSIAALAAELEAKEAFRVRWENVANECLARPQGWSAGRLLVSLGPLEGIGMADCPVSPSDFEFDLRTGKRKGLPPYPWKVIDCPNGGWTSSVGTMLTDCDDPDAHARRMIRRPLPRLPGAAREEEPKERELPEAVALSETEIFVMEPEPKQPYRWFRGSAKGKGLTFIVDGPSVLTFKPKGVTVEQVKWKYGQAVFESPLRDDWHLISRGLEHALVRFNRVP